MRDILALQNVPARQENQATETSPTSKRADELVQRFEMSLGIPFTSGNSLQVLVNGDEIFPAMLLAIRNAKRCVDFLSFVYWQGDIARRIADAFIERAMAGVRVRVLLDAFGAKKMDDSLVERMKAAGVQVEWFRPLSFLPWKNLRRTHRKLLICDDCIGFTGGVGIGEEWQGNAEKPGNWRDTHFRLTGPALNGLRAAFIGNWLESAQGWEPRNEPLSTVAETGVARVQVVRATSSYGWSDIATLQRTAVAMAETSIKVATPYFVPDSIMCELLCDAVARGVQVDILTASQEHTDSMLAQRGGDDMIGSLLEVGVRIHRFEPCMLHLKKILVDDTLAIVGSANFNQRSMRRDDEACLTIVDEVSVSQLRDQFADDLGRSRRVTLENWQKRSTWRRICEAASGLWRSHV